MIGVRGLSLSGERSRLTRAALVALNKFGPDAHVWIPGIGYINGATAGNYIDSAGTQAGLVDNPVGRANDAVGAITATQGTTANKPILRRGAVNLLTYSEQFDNAAWVLSATTSINPNSAVAPNGSSTADKLQEIGGTSVQYFCRQAFSFNVGTYTATFYAKAQERNWVYFEIGNTYANVDLSNGAIGSTGQFSTGWTFGSVSATPVGNNWYRCTITSTCTIAGSYTGLKIHVASSNNIIVFNGIAGNGIYIWGAQLELGSTASEYIPTTTAAASSSSGNYYWQFDGSNDSLALSSVPFQMADDHCVVVGIRNATAIVSAWGISNSASNVQYIARVRRSATNTITADWRDDATVAITHSTTLNDNAIGVISARNVSGTKIGRLNGVQFGTSSTAQGATTVNVANIGANIATTTTYWNGSIYPVIAIKGTVSDADLLTLEKWVGSLSGVSI